MAKEQKDMWTAFHKSLPVPLTTEWATLSTEARKIRGKWTRVFLSTAAAGESPLSPFS